MALPEVTNYDPSVYEILVTDAVEGYNPANPNTAANVGISNQAALNLANRTNWLYTNLNLLISGETIPATVAPLLSPEFEGSPTAPTPALGDDTTKLSTTAFVQGTLAGVLALSVAGGTNVALTAVQAGNGILNFSGALTANIAVLLPNTSGKWIVENNTNGAFTLTVKTAAGTGVAVTQGKSVEIYGDGTNVYLATNDFSNIQLTGQPTSPTPAIGDQSLKIANTDFVWQFVDGAVNVPVGGGSNVTLTPAQYGNGILLLQGALTAAISVKLPSQSGQWIVANQTTGAFGLTMGVLGSAGGTATIPQGQSVIVYSDGTNVILAGAAASSSFSYHTFTATLGQTDFPCPYTPGNIVVIQDGAVLASANYTATDGANVILNTGAPLNDEIQIIAFSSFTVANAVVRTGGSMLGALQLFGGDTGVTPAQNDNSTKLATTAWGNGIAAHGQCRLGATTQTSLTLSQYNGCNIIINGTVQQIPAAGVTISNAGLAASTLYYVYAIMNAGVMSLQLSTTGHVTGTNGVQICNGFPALTLVGMVYTTTSGQFQNGEAARCVLSYFNRLPIQCGTQMTGSGSTSSTVVVELNTNWRIYLLTWGDCAVVFNSNAEIVNTAAGGAASFGYGVSFDGAANILSAVSATVAGAGYGQPVSCAASVYLTEGLHFTTPVGDVAGANTITVQDVFQYVTVMG